MELIFYSAVALTLFFVITLLLTPVLLRPSVAETRLLSMVDSNRKDERQISDKERFEASLLEIATRFRSILGLSYDDVLKAKLESAGYRTRGSADLYTAVRFMAPLAGVVAASFTTSNTFFWILAGAGIGYLAPDMWLRSRIKARKNRLRKGVPDAVDLLVICMDAGLGLDQALLRVGQELSFTHPDISQEFNKLNLEQRAGKPRVEAWRALADRTKLEEIAGFVNMLVQTERFGTPILASLTRLANDIRLKKRQHAEEMAAKVKIKILFPLVFFIFPCIFIVLLAPAMLSIAKTLGSISK